MKRLTPFIFFIFLTVSIFGQLPYSESFETDLGIWTQSASDDMDWIRNSGPTPTASTGPAVASDGSFYMYIEATGNENPPKTAFLEANFDFSGTNNPILSFDYHMWGSGIGNLRVYAYNGSTWTEVWNQFNDQGNFWHNAKVNLRNYADSSNVTIRFIAETNYSELGDIAIDNIKIRDIYFVNISKTDLTCGGYSNGEIDITIAGGFPPYEYSYDDGDTYFPDASTNHVFTGLPGGDYLIKVKDISGFEIAGGTINLSEPETPDITTNKVNVGPCAYSHNGEIEIFATGSSAPFTYSINGFAGPFQISNNFTGLDTGTYEIAVKNTNGCIALGNNVYIAAPTEIFVLDVQQQNILTCNGDCNGELQIFAGGGNTPLDYSINDGVSYSGNTFFSGLCAGNYRFTIQDSKGCVQVTDYYTLTQPDALTFVDVSKTDVSGCFGDDNGIIDAEATGGTGTIQYSIDNGFLYQDSGYFENLSAGTYHLVIRDTKNCFKDWGLIEIFQPDLLLIDSVVVLNVQGCYGDADGEIHIYTQGGTGTVDYSIDNGTTLQGSPDFLPVDIGYYYPYVVDQNGCERTAPSVQITQPLPLLISDVVTYDVSDCYGSNTGKIQIFASLGTTPYQFSIDGGMTYQPDFTFNTLTAGEYYPSVLDAHGCEVFADTVYINQPSQIIINDQFSTDVSCFEGSDGSIFVSASGGTGDIHYSINEGVTFPFINSTISYQPEGTYIIAVRDDNGCITLGDTLIITQPDSLSIDSVTVLNVLGCYGDSTGVITLHVSGGSSPIDYSIDNGLHSQGTNVFNNLPAKTGYIPFVVDAGGCYALSNPITIGQPPQLVVTNQDHTDVDTCHGVPAGSIEITAAGGTGTISYSIDGGLTYVANGGVFTGLYAGDYDIFVSDANSCISEGWQENVYEPDTLLIDSLYFKDVVCNGQGNGQINIYASGGIPQIMYSINGGFTYSPSWQFTNLPPGNYNILVKDLYNCQVSDFVSLIQPPVFNIDTVIYTNVETCFGDNTATITIEASGGVPDILYTYTKIGVTPTTFQAGNVFNNVLAGSYFATAKDANGCVQSSSAFTVTQPNQVTLQNYHGTDISCHGLVNGMINVTATGGVGEYVYSIDNGNNWYDNGGLFTDLPAGSYNVTAADTNGCVANFPVVISIHEPPQLQIFSITTYNPTCNGYSDGQISIYSIGGTGEYTYVLNDTIIQSQALFDSLAVGEYWITVYDENNCIAQGDTVEVIMPDSRAVFEAVPSEGCAPLDVQFTALTDAASFKWIMGDGDTTLYEDPSHLYLNSTDSTVIYEAQIIAYHGTCRDTAYADITVYSQPNLSFAVDTQVHYYPDTNVYITNLATEYQNYYWDFGDGHTSLDISPVFHSYSDCGIFDMSVTAENEFGCSDTSIIQITMTSVEPQASFVMDNINGCAPLIVNFTNLSANSLSYEWRYDSQLFSTEENPITTFEEDGYYNIVLNAYGYCNKVSSRIETIEVYPTPIIDFELDIDTAAMGQTVLFSNYSTGGTYYIWDFGDGEGSSEYSPRRPYNTSGWFDVTLYGTSSSGCRDSMTIENAIYIPDTLFFTFPTAFSPDGDGLNDLFEPFYNLVEYCTVEIYNRSGQPVFITENFNTIFWDGTKNGTPLPIDTYVWRAYGRFYSGQYFERIGKVTIIR